jgi:NADH-quinone oxidoreductase subunit M
MLAALIFLPLLAALATYFMRDRQGLWFALLVALADLGIAVEVSGGNVLTSSSWPWLPSLGIAFDLHVGSFGILLLLLTPLLTACALASLSTQRLERESELAGHMLLMLGCLQGLFCSNNLGLFYFFFEAMLLPAVLMTARWGGENGRRAALKFFLYTFMGSLPMLLGILMIASQQAGAPDLSFRTLGPLNGGLQRYLFWWFFLAFAVKVPLFPLHGWIKDLYGSAPAPVVAVIAGAMSKAGLFGFFRVVLKLCPDAAQEFSYAISWLAVLSLLYGAFCALGGKHLREILAFSSLSHLGLMVLGIFSMNRLGNDGVILQMLAHGVVTGGLFLCVAVLEERGLPGRISDLGGLSRPMPAFAALFQVFCLASLGLPGLCSFPGELTILTGAYHADPLQALFALSAVVWAAWYLLRLYQGVMQGKPSLELALRDISAREYASLLPLLVLVFWIGFFPGYWMTLARTFSWS